MSKADYERINDPSRLRPLRRRVGGVIEQYPGDVPVLCFTLEVCNTDDTFDVWIDGRMTSHHSLSLEQVVKHLGLGERR